MPVLITRNLNPRGIGQIIYRQPLMDATNVRERIDGVLLLYLTKANGMHCVIRWGILLGPKMIDFPVLQLE
jgi:hypothetical protein